MDTTPQPDRDIPHILIVDDDLAIRNLLDSILSDTYSCTLAESAEAALKCIEDQVFDLVISDINLGGMDGLELTSRVRAASPETVVMMISGNLTLESPIEAIRSGAFDYISKPFDIDQVEMAVSRAVSHAKLLVSKRKHENRLEELVAERTLKLNYLAYHDPLTGLRNRFFFEDSLARAIDGRAGSIKIGVFFISLDGFKFLRDTLGHSTGDGLLVESARRLEHAAGAAATVARFEGDEFAALLSVESPEELDVFLKNISAAFIPPLKVGDDEIKVTVSIGISISPDDGETAATLLKNAGAALAHVRKKGGNHHDFFTMQLQDSALRRHTMENELRRALDRREFQLYYQPKLNIAANKIIGMEALIRWLHPELGLVAPYDFIPLAEETGLIVPIGEWVLQNSCEQSKIWNDNGFDLDLAVNLSPRQFQQKDLAGKVKEILRDTGFDPKRLNLELTESSIMNNTESAVVVLRELRETGIRISIDDFGTGYSSLGILKDLPIDVLKIDKSFVNDVTSNPDDAALVIAVITLAHNLQLKVVAEGVETEEQLGFLKDLNCDEWQGYLFSKPVPAIEFERLLTL